MTTNSEHTPLDVLRRPVVRDAHLTPDSGILTIGEHADGTFAAVNLGYGRHARHTTILGRVRTGKTTLLRSILAAAKAADVDTNVIDLYDGSLADTGHPTARTFPDAYRMLRDQLVTANQLIAEAAETPTGIRQPLRLLVLHNLHMLVADARCARLIETAVRDCSWAGLAVVTDALDLTYTSVGGGTGPYRSLLTENLIQLGNINATDASIAGYDPMPPLPNFFNNDQSITAGIGYLPRSSNTTPFRAWMPTSATGIR